MNIPDDLVDSFARHKGIIFVGPELSALEGKPPLEQLSARLAAEIEGADLMRLDENSPLHYSTLSVLMGNNGGTGGLSKQPFEEIAQDYEIEYGREQLIARLSEHLNGAKASGVQQKLVQLPMKAVVTTNYDQMLEEALLTVGRESVVIYSEKEEGAARLPALEAMLWQEEFDTQRPLPLIKLYGDLQATENLLTTASDLEYYRVNHPHLGRLLGEMGQGHGLLYVGYEPSSEGFRRLLRLTKRKRQGGALHFVLLPLANERTVTKLMRRGLRVINLGKAALSLLEDGGTNLRQLGVIEAWLTAFGERVEQKKGEAGRRQVGRGALPSQPYKFLDFFGGKDGALFYGREVETALLYRQVLSSKLSVLYGESAAGKTSLLQAALLPRLKREGFVTIYLRPMVAPLAELREAIIQRLGNPPLPKLGEGRGEGDRLAGLLAATRSVPEGGKGVVLVLDQAERLFGLGMDGARERLMAELMEVLAGEGVRILLSVRSDYLDRLDELGGFLGEDPLRYRFRLRHLSVEGARMALLKPAELFGLRIEAGLEEALLKDLQVLGLTGANLQIVCQRLWEGWVTDGRGEEGLLLTEYALLGGAAQILPGYLDWMIDDLVTREVRERYGVGLDGEGAVDGARLVLKRMVVARDGQEVSEQLVTSRDLQQSLSIEPKEVTALLGFLEKRALVRRVGSQSKLYELAHGVMIERIWEWFGAEERLRLNLQDVLERALIDYKAFGWRLPLNQLLLVSAHAEGLALTHDVLQLLLVSAIEHDQETALWIERLEGEDVVRLLAAELALGKRAHYGAIIEGLGRSHPKAMPYLESLLGDRDNKIQRQAVEGLLRLGVARVAQVFYHAARQEEQLSRVVPLIEGLERVQTKEAIELLSLLASDHRNPHVRSRAVNGLAYLGHSQGIGLIARLAGSEEERIREDALSAARRLWEEKPGEFEGLLRGYDVQMKLDVIGVLEMVGKEEVSDLLIERLTDRSALVAEAAAKVLLALSPLAGARFEKLVAVLEAEDGKMQGVVVRLLADLGDKRATSPLLALLKGMRYPTVGGGTDEKREEERLEVTAALGSLYALPYLKKLGSRNGQVREEAAEALGYLADRRTIEPLMTALWDSDKGVRAAVAKALGDVAAVGGTQGKDEAARKLAQGAGVEEVKRAITPLLIALRDKEASVRAAVALALGEMGKLPLDAVSRIVEPLASRLNDEVPEVRIAVARALGQFSDGRVIPPLLTALEDEVPEVRMVVANALERLQGLPEAQKVAAAVEPLLVALSDEAARVRMAAAEALGKSGEKRAIPALEAALKDDDYLVRLSAIGALGRLYPLPMLKALGGEDGQARREAAQALGTAADGRVVEPLIAVLSDESPMVTIAAVSSLGQLGDKRATEALVAILHHGSPQERMAVSRALGQLMDVRAVSAMIGALSDPHPKARRRAALVLGKLGSGEAVEPLIELLTDHDSQIRMAAAKALGQLDDRRAVKPLIELLDDGIHRVRGAAAKGLGNLGDRRATEPLVQLLRDDEFLVRQAAISALGELWHLPLLRQLGYYRDARARSTAASALIGEECDSPIGRLYLEALIASLQDKAPSVRIEAARALGHFKDERARAPLQAAKDDKNSKVRIEISRALRQLRQSQLNQEEHAAAADEKAVDTLPALGQLKSPHATLRRLAAETLGDSNDERAVEPLIEALADEEMLVRVAVVRALERLGDKRAIQPLIQASQDVQKIVRLAAISALGVLWDLLLLIQLGSERTEERRQAAMQSDVFVNLQREGNLQIVELLIATLHDEVAVVRKAAIVSIGELADKRATAALLKRLRDEDEGVRVAVCEALIKLNDRRAIAPLVEALRDDEPLVRLSVVRALGHLYDVPALCELGAYTADRREAAAKVLGGLADGRTAEPLIALLRDESGAVRGAAANALRGLGIHAIHSLLLALEESEAAGVRRHVARILGQLRGVLEGDKQGEVSRRVRSLLTAALQDPDGDTRQQAAISLRQLGDHNAIEQSLQDLYDADPEIRHRAASVLGQLRDKQALGPLMTACTDLDARVREEAARSLGQLRDSRAEASLLTLLDDEQAKVRYAATQALALLWQEPTLAQLGSSEMQVRSTAARALGRQKNVRFLEPLGAALNDDEAVVRIAAAEALGELGDKGAIATVGRLVKALHDPEEEVQKRVAKVLRQLEDVRDVERLVEPVVQPSYEGGVKPSSYKREEYLKQRSTMRALGALWNRPLLAQLGSEKAEIRLEAARQLGQSGDLYAVKPLLTALSDESLLVCYEVADCLANFDDERIADALIERLSTTDAKLRLIIVRSLGKLGDRKAIRPLLKMRGTASLPMQLALIEALGKLGGKEAIEPLEALLEEVTDEGIRRELIGALAILYDSPLLRELANGDPERRRAAAMAMVEKGGSISSGSVRLLLALLAGAYEVPSVRIAVMKALVAKSAGSGMGAMKAIVAELTKCLQDELLEVRRAAMRGLGELYEAAELRLLGSDDAAADERLTAARWLRQCQLPMHNELLLATLRDDELAVRLAATRGLAERWELPSLALLGDVKAEARRQGAKALARQPNNALLMPLLAALQDPDAGVRHEVVHTLGVLGDKRAIPALIMMLSDGNSKVRGGVAAALQLLGKDNVEALLPGLEERTASTRRHVARILGALGKKEAITPLIGLLQDVDGDVRQQAAISLRQLGAERAIVPALLALRDTNPVVRMRAASVMGQLRDLRVLKLLVASLEDQAVEVRQEAARSLGQLRDLRAVRPLIKALRDEDTEVRRRAAGALKHLGDREAISALKAIAFDEDAGVREAVQEALRVLEAV